VSPKVLASHRQGAGTETRRVLRSSEGVKDICRLNSLFANQHPAFSVERGRARASIVAWGHYLIFKRMGDEEAAAANYDMWKQITPVGQRLSYRFDTYVIAYIRRARQLGLRGTISRARHKLLSRLAWKQPNY
jgi:hypothetical protein